MRNDLIPCQSIIILFQNHAQQMGQYPIGWLYEDEAPEILKNGLVSGTNLIADSDGEALFSFVPSVGCSSLSQSPTITDEQNDSVICLSKGHYGDRNKSTDYPLHFTTIDKSEKEEIPVTDAMIIFDQDQFLQWENGGDLSLAYRLPDSSWDDFSTLRALTGYDFHPEAMVFTDDDGCTIVADGLSPLFFQIDTRGLAHVVTSSLIR